MIVIVRNKFLEQDYETNLKDFKYLLNKINKEKLLSKFPFTKEALKDIMSWESNREFVEKYEEKRNVGKH